MKNINEKKTITDTIFLLLREQILSEKLKSGDRLFESEISAQTGASRTPIREAFKKLELFGLVKIIPNKGVFVAGYSKRDIEDIFLITNEIDRHATVLAFERITEPELEEMKETLDLMKVFINKGNVTRAIEFNDLFHNILYDATKSRYFCQVIREFQYFTDKTINEALYYSIENLIDVNKEHYQLYEAFVEKDRTKLEKGITEHLKGSNRRIGNIISRVDLVEKNYKNLKR